LLSGSDSDDFSNILVNQVAYALAREPYDADAKTRLVEATVRHLFRRPAQGWDA
jgi:hypothetical protein